MTEVCHWFVVVPLTIVSIHGPDKGSHWPLLLTLVTEQMCWLPLMPPLLVSEDHSTGAMHKKIPIQLWDILLSLK